MTDISNLIGNVIPDPGGAALERLELWQRGALTALLTEGLYAEASLTLFRWLGIEPPLTGLVLRALSQHPVAPVDREVTLRFAQALRAVRASEILLQEHYEQAQRSAPADAPLPQHLPLPQIVQAGYDYAFAEAQRVYAPLQAWQRGAVAALMGVGEKIQAIKLVRGFTACGLHAAKILVEELLPKDLSVPAVPIELVRAYQAAERENRQDDLMGAVSQLQQAAGARRVNPHLPDLSED